VSTVYHQQRMLRASLILLGIVAGAILLALLGGIQGGPCAGIGVLFLYFCLFVCLPLALLLLAIVRVRSLLRRRSA
jgi:hypothetical protein